MPNHTYSISEIVGTSTEGVDAAVRNGVAEAAKTLRNLDWFEVKEIRGHLEDGQIADWQVTIKLGFRVVRGRRSSRWFLIRRLLYAKPAGAAFVSSVRSLVHT